MSLGNETLGATPLPLEVVNPTPPTDLSLDKTLLDALDRFQRSLSGDLRPDERGATLCDSNGTIERYGNGIAHHLLRRVQPGCNEIVGSHVYGVVPGAGNQPTRLYREDNEDRILFEFWEMGPPNTRGAQTRDHAELITDFWSDIVDYLGSVGTRGGQN